MKQKLARVEQIEKSIGKMLQDHPETYKYAKIKKVRRRQNIIKDVI